MSDSNHNSRQEKGRRKQKQPTQSASHIVSPKASSASTAAPRPPRPTASDAVGVPMAQVRGDWGGSDLGWTDDSASTVSAGSSGGTPPAHEGLLLKWTNMVRQSSAGCPIILWKYIVFRPCVVVTMGRSNTLPWDSIRTREH